MFFAPAASGNRRKSGFGISNNSDHAVSHRPLRKSVAAFMFPRSPMSPVHLSRESTGSSPMLNAKLQHREQSPAPILVLPKLSIDQERSAFRYTRMSSPSLCEKQDRRRLYSAGSQDVFLPKNSNRRVSFAGPYECNRPRALSSDRESIGSRGRRKPASPLMSVHNSRKRRQGTTVNPRLSISKIDDSCGEKPYPYSYAFFSSIPYTKSPANQSPLPAIVPEESISRSSRNSVNKERSNSFVVDRCHTPVTPYSPLTPVSQYSSQSPLSPLTPQTPVTPLTPSSLYPYNSLFPSPKSSVHSCSSVSTWGDRNGNALHVPNLLYPPGARLSITMPHLQDLPLADLSKKDIRSRLTIRVSGEVFETYEDTLNAYPSTLLGNPSRRAQFFNVFNNEYEFERDYYTFNAILFYYQSGGILAKPVDVDRKTFIDEVEFFELDAYVDVRHKEETEFLERQILRAASPTGKTRRKIWEVLEPVHGSLLSSMFFYISIMIIVLSVTAFCAETVPTIRVAPGTAKSKDIWFLAESCAISYFTFEYILRLYATPNPKSYAASPLGIVDAITIIPYFVHLILLVIDIDMVEDYKIFRLLVLLRVLRIFKLARYHHGLRVLIMTIHRSIHFIGNSLLLIVSSSLMFASVVYFSENIVGFVLLSPVPTGKEQFTSIFDALWFTVITETTVGYGDLYPSTFLGKSFGALCAICGALLFCLPLPMLVYKFVECFYLYELIRLDGDSDRMGAISRMREDLEMES